MSVKVKSNAKQVSLLIKAAGKQIEKNAEKIVARSAARIQTKAQKYPSPPPNSTYRRTNTLKSGWRQEVEGLSAQVFNRVEYAVYVQGFSGQAEVHQGRWQTDEDLARQEMKLLQKEIDSELLKGL